MSLIKKILAATCVCCAMVSCSNDSNPYNNVEYYPVKVEGDHDWSFVNLDGKVICQDTYSHQPSCIVNGYFSVEESDGYTMYKLNGDKPVEVEGLSGLLSVGCYNEGLIGIVRDSERITFVDGNGNTKFTLNPVRGKEIVSAQQYFCNGRIMIKDIDGKIGFADKDGQIVINPKYDDALPFLQDKTLVGLSGDDDDDFKIFVIDRDGKEILKFKSTYQFVEFHEDVICIREQGSDDEWRYGILSLNGELKKLPAKVKGVSDLNDKMVIYSNGERRYGLMDFDGNTLIMPKYNSLTFVDNYSCLLAEKDNKYKFIDFEGNDIDSKIDDYSNVRKLSEKADVFMCKDGSSWYLVNKKGETVGNEGFTAYDDDIVISGRLRSDYFPSVDFASELAKYINERTVGNYQIGKPATTYLHDPNGHSSYYFSPDDENVVEGTMFTIKTTKVTCTERIADYNYDYYTYSSYYTFNPSSKVDGGSVVCRSDTHNFWGKVKQPVIDAYKARGFSLVSDEDNKIIMKYGKATLSVSLSSADIVAEVLVSQE